MASALKNLSNHKKDSVPNAKNMRFGIVLSEWNSDITESLCQGAVQTLLKNGVLKKNISLKKVPGSFELTLGARFFAASKQKPDAIICLGCVIKGETKHFDFICQAVAEGITQLNILYNLPVVFGVLTTDNLKQAQERSGGKHGNKGVEAAITAIKMVALQKNS